MLNRLGFRFLFLFLFFRKTSEFPNISISIQVTINSEKCLTFDESQEFTSVDTLLQTENGTNRKTTTSVCFLQIENGNGKIPFVC
jgi:hypothetical protein